MFNKKNTLLKNKVNCKYYYPDYNITEKKHSKKKYL